MGRIRADKNKPYSIYIVSSKETIMYILKRINGLIRLKIPGFKEACILYNLDYIEANYNIALYDPYFAGLVDTDGSIVFNHASLPPPNPAPQLAAALSQLAGGDKRGEGGRLGNRIECNLEFKYNEYTSKLNFDNTILHSKPFIIKRAKSSKSGGPKDYISIAFKFQSVNNMLFIYDYFIHNRLYCDVKFYRVMKIKSFFEIRKYKTSPKHSLEHRIYSNFVIDLLKYQNPL